ncbi:MAG: glycerophosphoryl diester phosphodiesterase membrane domain-containing protein [Candidatus Dormibacteraeota bacterium]|uniref:Glycerophosphoryl diester phosphodiesterase membrane domain-containing protein n=1 Tax=Candidatus Aeolococcus gillhamiae TaxID=3127015 RepID=A0A934JRI9_9BACT|nr:glycerophosphoryl diester phosphodiesterase membrane domain-containing protein [Candidatus Dormibacteraeota bacterium]
MSASPPPPPPPPPPPGGWPQLPGWGPPGPAPAWQGPGGPPPGWGWQQQPVLPVSGRFRAQTVGELLDSAFTLYRRNVRLILSITAVVQLPLAVFSYITYQLTGITSATTRLQQLSAGGTITSEQLSNVTSTLFTLLAVVFGIALLQALVVQPIATAAMTRAVGDIYLDQPASLGSAYRAVGQRLGAVVGVSMLLFGFGILLFGVSFGLVAGAVYAFGSGGSALLILVLPAAVFAAILMYTRWLFATPIVMLERARPVAALRRSWRLVRGTTPRVFGITILVGLITGILGAIVGGLINVLTQFGDVGMRLLLTQLASLVVAVLIQPISFIVVVLLYYDLRIRKEAFDIEMLAASI